MYEHTAWCNHGAGILVLILVRSMPVHLVFYALELALEQDAHFTIVLDMRLNIMLQCVNALSLELYGFPYCLNTVPQGI